MYKTLTLAVGKDTARQTIAERVPDVEIRTVDEIIEARTRSGVLLAVLSDVTLPSGEQGTKFRYRTTLMSPTLSHARTQAQSIRRAVEQYKYRTSSGGS